MFSAFYYSDYRSANTPLQSIQDYQRLDTSGYYAKPNQKKKEENVFHDDPSEIPCLKS